MFDADPARRSQCRPFAKASPGGTDGEKEKPPAVVYAVTRSTELAPPRLSATRSGLAGSGTHSTSLSTNL